MKICLIKTSSMGDIIHTLPALTDAQHAIENLEVDWVLEEDFAEIPRWHSAIRNILPVAIRRWRKTYFLVLHGMSGKVVAFFCKVIIMMLSLMLKA